MIYKLASNFPNDSKEDLYQVGVIGLINAYNNYDDSYGAKFSTYAYPYILGEMKKYVRENKNIKIGRDISYLSSRLDRLIELLCQKYNRMPTTKELSVEAGVDEWKIIEALNVRNCVSSLDEPINSDTKELTMMDMVGDDRSSDDLLELDEMMSYLTLDERNIIIKRYFCNKSQSEIAKLTGYSQAKVSREEQKILNKLKKYYS